MKKQMTARIKGAFFITRQANHHIVHLCLGVLWYYFLMRFIPDLGGPYHLFLSILGSELPDIEHLLYFYTHGKKDAYSLQVRFLIRHRMWRELTLFLKNNHKHLTALKFHSLQWVFILCVLTWASFVYDHYSILILLGAMVTHYCFDVVDDIIFLGKINPNWKKGLIHKPKFL